MMAPPTTVAAFGASPSTRKTHNGTKTISVWAKIVIGTAGTNFEPWLNNVVPTTMKIAPCDKARLMSFAGGNRVLPCASVITEHRTIIIAAYPDRTGAQSLSGFDRTLIV